LQTNNTFATNYNIRFPFVEGAKLWVLTWSWWAPIQDFSETVNLSSLSTGTKAYLSNSEIQTWTNLKNINSKASCKRLYDAEWKRNDWVYKINPTGSSKLNVYCDMTTDWGWWTIVYNQVWSDNEKIVWELDETTWIAWTKTEHRIDPRLIYSWQDKLELLLMQDSRWIKLKDINKDSFDNIFNGNWQHWDDLAISGSSTWIWPTLMDQDNYDTWGWVYQWNVVGDDTWNKNTCFEYTKKDWTDDDHEWIVFPNCDWRYSKTSWIWYPRRWIVWVR
jgi:hypothetical protein